MKTLSCISMLLLMTGHGFSQIANQAEIYAADYIEALNMPTSQGGIVMGKARSAPGVDGDPYLFEDFFTGEIVLKNNKKLLDATFNVDLYNDILILKKDSALYTLGFHLVNSFNIAGTDYVVNVFDYDLTVSKVLYRGENGTLYAYNSIKIKDPTYVEGVDVGNPNAKILKNEHIYLQRNGKSFELKSKKDLQKAFADSPALVETIRKEKVKPKDVNELVKLLNEAGY